MRKDFSVLNETLIRSLEKTKNIGGKMINHHHLFILPSEEIFFLLLIIVIVINGRSNSFSMHWLSEDDWTVLFIRSSSSLLFSAEWMSWTDEHSFPQIIRAILTSICFATFHRCITNSSHFSRCDDYLILFNVDSLSGYIPKAHIDQDEYRSNRWEWNNERYSHSIVDRGQHVWAR